MKGGWWWFGVDGSEGVDGANNNKYETKTINIHEIWAK